MLKDLLVRQSNTAVDDSTMSVGIAFLAVAGTTRTLFDPSIVSVLFRR